MTTCEATPRTSTGVSIEELDPITVKQLLDEGQAVLLDVREPDEFQREHIPGARLTPLGTLRAGEIIPTAGVRTILHCRSGQRSQEACRFWLAAGAGTVAQLSGGLEAWKRAGLPTVTNRMVRYTVMQQTQMVIGALVLASVAAGAFWNPWALLLAAFMGGGLLVAGLTGTCALATVLGRLPWNRAGRPGGSCGIGCTS